MPGNGCSLRRIPNRSRLAVRIEIRAHGRVHRTDFFSSARQVLLGIESTLISTHLGVEARRICRGRRRCRNLRRACRRQSSGWSSLRRSSCRGSRWVLSSTNGVHALDRRAKSKSGAACLPPSGARFSPVLMLTQRNHRGRARPSLPSAFTEVLRARRKESASKLTFLHMAALRNCRRLLFRDAAGALSSTMKTSQGRRTGQRGAAPDRPFDHDHRCSDFKPRIRARK